MPKKLPWKFIYKKSFDSFDKFKDFVASELNYLVAKSQPTNCTKCTQYTKSKHKMKYIILECDGPNCNMVEHCALRYRVKVCEKSTTYEFERLNEHNVVAETVETANVNKKERKRHGK